MILYDIQWQCCPKAEQLGGVQVQLSTLQVRISQTH